MGILNLMSQEPDSACSRSMAPPKLVPRTASLSGLNPPYPEEIGQYVTKLQRGLGFWVWIIANADGFRVYGLGRCQCRGLPPAWQWLLPPAYSLMSLLLVPPLLPPVAAAAASSVVSDAAAPAAIHCYTAYFLDFTPQMVCA